MSRQIRKILFALITVAVVTVSAELLAYVCYILIGSSYFAPAPTRAEFLHDLQQQYEAENFDRKSGMDSFSAASVSLTALGLVQTTRYPAARACRCMATCLFLAKR